MYNNQAATLMKKVSFIYDRPIDPIFDFGLFRDVPAQIIGKIKGLFFCTEKMLNFSQKNLQTFSYSTNNNK